MRIHKRNLLAAIGVLSLAFAAAARAQDLFPFGPANYEHDLQFFAPVELDLDNEPYSDDFGYFFSYEKMAASYTGERTLVGDPDVLVLAEQIYTIRPQDELNTAVNPVTGLPLFPNGAPEPFPVNNSLTDVFPDAGFAFGDRYEFGYHNDGNGWRVGILDGADLQQNRSFGFGNAPAGLSPPFLDPDYTNNTDVPGATGPQAGGNLRAFGFGSVPVNFRTPSGYLFGFRDYLNLIADAQLGTQGGPTLYVGNYGLVLETLNQNNNNFTFAFFRLADDIDGDLVNGSGFVIDANGNLVAFTDFQDLHEFNIFFEQVDIHSRTFTSGVETMWTHELTNRHYMAKHQNNHVELSMGARFLRMYDQFDFDGFGSILGRTTVSTSIDNQIVGPQVGIGWTNQRQRWTLSADARFMFGYNIEDWKQLGDMGEELVPGALNRPLFARATSFSHALQRDDFSPVGELRVETGYYLTQSVTLKAGYTGMFVGHIRRAGNSVLYQLPDWGYHESGTQDLLVNGLNAGVEFVH